MSRPITIAAAPHVAFRKLSAEGAVVLHLKSAAYFRLNELGATIWGMVQDETPFNEVVSRISSLYEETPAELETEIAQFVDELASRDLLTVRPLS
ncbi:MAG TPA: PqqD family protein [Longimicrobiales bacterium]|nr:PqqD family protein [Longimicrobiales bacterium]